MPSTHADRNLLYIIVALQMDVIARDELIDAMLEWADDPTRNLGDVLLARVSMTSDERHWLDSLVLQQVERLDSDVEIARRVLSRSRRRAAGMLEMGDVSGWSGQR